ncbi:hypothetical protein [Leptolyngbya iicbica]|uniref:Uncharacterized protein n=2 Tax=Cyanophyceae TaxID=3028117 RepID=A0A4Q7E536_9CYAN|nr:hypothetical protein [Leptolyngbya sp. LK]RZM77184.1 hypothetical protein DYY88_16170 [Leptolyngbya sp. LK]
MQHPSPFTPAERIESAKVAIAGGFIAGFIGLAWLLFSRYVQGEMIWAGLLSGWNLANLTLLVNGAISALSGSLFALTYRYAIRQDDNPQLRGGVVLAFTLVRGLAEVDASSAIAQNFWPFLTACGESFILFGGCAIALNLAFAQQWLKPFGPDS